MATPLLTPLLFPARGIDWVRFCLPKMLVAVFILQCFTIATVVPMRGPHHPRGGHYHHSPQRNQKLTQDTQLLQDVEHIKEDLNNILSNDQAHRMTPEELEFHYFKLHDFDNNTKLDGLEILQAIHHSTHNSDVDESDYEDDKNRSKMKDTINNIASKTSTNSQTDSLNENSSHDLYTEEDFQYFVDLIDQVLEEDDLDNDGYLSYIEYVVGRQKEHNRKNSKQKHNYK